MNKAISTFIFTAFLAVFTFSALPASACTNTSKCASKMEKPTTCKKKMKKATCSKCKKSTCKKKMTPDHNDNSRYND